MRVLFVHGAGGFVEDQAIADALQARLQVRVEMPQMPESDMSVEAWAAPVRQHLAALTADDVVIGHSFGASILQWVLPEQAWSPSRVLLLATPDWSPEGWDVPEYVHPGPEPRVPVSLHHCHDDDVVPFEHLALTSARMPTATVVEHPDGGHQFVGRTDAIAAHVTRSDS